MKKDNLTTNNAEIKIIVNGKPQTLLLREFRQEDVLQIYKSWSNPQNYRYNEITWDINDVMEMVKYPCPTSWGMFYKVAEIKETGEIVATCRFGTRYDTKPEDMVWDFGYNVFRTDDKEIYTIEDIKTAFKNGVTRDSSWGKGYGKAILCAIIEIARKNGVKKLIAGADSRNFGSQKVMMKNGFVFYRTDEDYDVQLCLDLTKPTIIPSPEELAHIWEEHEKLVKAHIEKNNSKINEIDTAHFYDAIFYLLLNRVLEIEKLSNLNLIETNKLKNEIACIVNNMSADELSAFTKHINVKIKVWKENVKPENLSVKHKLELCKILQTIFNELNLIISDDLNI